MQSKTENLQEKIDILSADATKVDEEGAKREILNFLLDEESGFEI